MANPGHRPYAQRWTKIEVPRTIGYEDRWISTWFNPFEDCSSEEFMEGIEVVEIEDYDESDEVYR